MNKVQDQTTSQVNSAKHLKKIAEERMLLNSFYKLNITSRLKQEEDNMLNKFIGQYY